MTTTPLTLILGSGDDARRVRSSLVDLAALGMVDQFLWAEADTEPQSKDMLVDVIGAGVNGQLQLAQTDLTEALASDGRQQALIVVLDMAGDPDPDAGSLRDWRSAVDAVFKRSSHTLHLVVPNEETGEPVQFGMQTLVLSPEDSETPLVPVRTVDYPAVQHIATSIASLSGLWSTAETSPYVDAVENQELSGDAHGYARLVRTYHHALDASEAEAYFHDEVFDIDGNLPHPRLPNGGPVVDAGNDDAGTTEMSQELMRPHAEEFVSERTPLETPRSRQISAWTAIKRFFVFFFTAVIGSPKSWLHSIQSTGEKTLATGVQNLLYGEDSNIEVVVGRHSGRGSSSIEEISTASDSLSAQIDDSNRHVEVGEDPALGNFWRSYVASSLSLVDGHRRLDGKLGGMSQNNIPAIVSDTRIVVPSAADAFDGDNPVLRNELGPNLGSTRVQSYDPDGARRYEQAISYASQQTTDSGVHKLKDQFQQWQSQSSRSYAWKVGSTINGAVDAARKKIRDCRADAADIQNRLQSLPDSASAVQKMANRMRLVTGIWFVLLLVIMYISLAHYNPEAGWALVNWPLTWQRALFAGIALTLITLLIQALIFARGQRNIFDRFEEKRLLRKAEQAVAADLQAGIRELKKVTAAYSQFLAWSAILGRVLAHPFGEISERGQTNRHPEDGLPHNTVISVGKPVSAVAEKAVDSLRQEIFPAGWAGTAFSQNVDRAIESARARVSGSEDRSELFGQPGTRSQLAAVAEVCEAGEGLNESQRANEAWSQGLIQLRSNDSVLSTSVTDKGADFDIRAAMNKIDSGEATSSEFVHAAMNARGINEGGTKVDEGIRYRRASRSPESLSESYTVVEYGMYSDLRAFARGAQPRSVDIDAPPAIPELPSLGGDQQAPTPATRPTPPASDPLQGFDGLF